MSAADLTGPTIKSSAEAAKVFVDHYYSQLNQGRSVVNLHVNVTAAYPAAGHKGAIIVANGVAVPSPRDWDAMLEKQRQPRGQQQPQDAPTTTTASSSTTATTTTAATATTLSAAGSGTSVRYEVESFNVHVLDRDYRFAMPANFPPDTGGSGAAARIMMVVSVVGTVTFRSAILSPSSSFPSSSSSSAAAAGNGENGIVTRSGIFVHKGDSSAIPGTGTGTGAGAGTAAGVVETRGFSDTFILVPNWDMLARPAAAAARGGRKYLIASHTYRTFRVKEAGGAEEGDGPVAAVAAVAAAAAGGAQGVAGKAAGAGDGLGFTGFVWGAE